YAASVDYFGGTGNDTFALDFRGGTNIIPTVGPNQGAFVGGAGTDQLRILDDPGGYVAGDVTYSYHIIQGMDLGAPAGTISIDGRGLTFQGLEGPIDDNLLAGNRFFNLPGGDGDNNAVLGDDPGDAQSRLTGTGLPLTDFRNPNLLLQVNDSNDGETT